MAGLNCLRFGLVHSAIVEHVTVGTEATLREIECALLRAKNEQKAQVLLIEADWGGGKTHTLTLAHCLAARLGFWTSRTEVCEEHCFSSAAALGASLYERLCEPGDWLGTGLEACIEAYCEISDVCSRVTMESFPRLYPPLAAARAARQDGITIVPEVASYLSGQIPHSSFKKELFMLGLDYSKTTAFWPGKRKVQCEELPSMLGELARLCRSVQGKAGLLAVVDELDLECFHSRSSYGRLYSHETAIALNGLVGASQCPLVVLCGTTPFEDDEYNPSNHMKRATLLTLPRLSSSQMETLVHNLRDLHQRVYSWSPSDEVVKEAFELAVTHHSSTDNTRSLTRTIVDHLDSALWRQQQQAMA